MSGTSEGPTLPDWCEAWIDEVIGGPVPAEPAATCDSCAMVHPPERSAAREIRFDPTTKCCTHLPETPNFLVGAILQEPDDTRVPARDSVRARIAAGDAVTPLGLRRTPAYLRHYRLDQPVFGRDPSVRCPHYLLESGRCGIWHHRESTCITWYCKHARGALGMAFWASLRALLRELEEQIAWWCVGRLGLHPGAVARYVAHAGSPGAEALAGAAWGAWDARREEFYRRCAAESAAFSWAEIERSFGPGLLAAVNACRAARARLADTSVPERLRSVPIRVLGEDDTGCRVHAYSRFDAQDVPHRIMRQLPAFDGRPYAEVAREIARNGSEPPDLPTLRRLLDFGVLEEAPENPLS